MMFFFNVYIALRKNNVLPSALCMLRHKKSRLADVTSSGLLFHVLVQISASFQGPCFPTLLNLQLPAVKTLTYLHLLNCLERNPVLLASVLTLTLTPVLSSPGNCPLST